VVVVGMGSRFGSRWFKVKTYNLEPLKPYENTGVVGYRFKVVQGSYNFFIILKNHHNFIYTLK